MDYVLVFQLIITLMLLGQSLTEMTACFKICPAGQYLFAPCSAGEYSCKECPKGTFTEVENTQRSCLRCRECHSGEVETKACTSNKNTKCECKEGFYKSGSKCEECKYCDHPNNHECKCERCLGKSCFEKPKYRKKCSLLANTTVEQISTTTKSFSTTEVANEGVNPTLWAVLVLVVVIFLLLIVFLLLFTGNRHRKGASCLRWVANKKIQFEDPMCKERQSHQGSSPTTLTLNICEETPMMLLSQSSSSAAHPAHMSQLRPDCDLAAVRHEEPSDHWPAILLYSIIKAVPLRRWKEFLRLLSVDDQQLERVELEAGSGQGSMEKQYQMLRLWSQRSSANLCDVFSALCYMDLSGCAQQLQESLEKIQWRPEMKQGSLTCNTSTD